VVATLAITGMVTLVAHEIVITSVTPLAAAIIGGTVMGMGLLAVTRHGTAVGGSTMIARWLSVKKGWNFGRLMMADAMIIATSFLVLEPATRALVAAERGLHEPHADDLAPPRPLSGPEPVDGMDKFRS
jgi:uncharacterized membrane-anchored protein YitT (DUF2179 family)